MLEKIIKKKNQEYDHNLESKVIIKLKIKIKFFKLTIREKHIFNDIMENILIFFYFLII